MLTIKETKGTDTQKKYSKETTFDRFVKIKTKTKSVYCAVL